MTNQLQYLVFRPGLALLFFYLAALSSPAWFSADKTEAGETLPPEFRAVTNQIAATQARYDALIRDVEKTLTAARARLTGLQAQEKVLTNEIAATEANLVRLKQVNEQRYQDLETQQDKLKQLETILAEKNARALQLADAIQAEKMIREKEEEMAALQRTFDEAHKKTAETTNRLTSEASNRQKEIAEQKKLLDAQAKTLADLQKGLAESRQAQAAAESRNKQLQERLTALEEQNKTLQATQQSALTGVAATLREFNEFLDTQTNAVTRP